MGAIDIGYGAEDLGGNYPYGYTVIDRTNPANDTGIIDTFEVYSRYQGMYNTKMGTWSGSGTSYAMRDFENIGFVYYGSKMTFTGLNCDVSIGDLIGAFFDYGTLAYASSGGSGILSCHGNQFDGNSHTFSLGAFYRSALYGIGAAPPPASSFIPQIIMIG